MTHTNAFTPLLTLSRYWRKVVLIWRMQGHRGLVRAVYRQVRAKQDDLGPEIALLPATDLSANLRFSSFADVTVSVIVEALGPRETTHHCLSALSRHSTLHPYEVIVGTSQPPHASLASRPLWHNVGIIDTSHMTDPCSFANEAASTARGNYLVFLSDTVRVQPGWLDAIVETFVQTPDAGAVGCRLMCSDGRQLEAGGVVWRDGHHARYGYLDDPYRPEYSYLRRVDYCSLEAFAVRTVLFHELRGFARQWGCSSFTGMDIAFRLRQAGHDVYYQPNAMVVRSCDDVTAIGVVSSGDAGFEALRRQFAETWSKVLRTHAVSMTDMDDGKARNVAKRVFVADYALPAPDRDSGSVRMFNLLMLLQEQGFKITFASMGLETRQPYLADLQGRGVECLYRPYVNSIQQYLRRRGEEYDLVILSRLETAAELQTYAFRWCRRAKVVFDTVDLHFQRLEREATVRDNARIRRLAERQRTEELKLIEQANLTLVVSEVERAYLTETVPDAKVRVLSNIHQIKGCRAPFEGRRDILFIGGFGHPPNTDAVIYFCGQVLPRILMKLPDVRFLVIGADPPAQIRRLANDRVEILGHVQDVECYLSNCRLSVAPLRFGAGVKGKINQSLAHGLPVVATTLAVEGMFLRHEESVMVADDPVAFADAVVRLYEDPNLWRCLSAAGVVTMAQHFSLDAARTGIKEMLSVCNIAPLAHDS